MLENHLLNFLARVALKGASPLNAKRLVDVVGGLFPPLSPAEARKVASRLEGHGTCLSRSLALAARVPGAEVVIGRVPGDAFWAHAWVERDGNVISPQAEAGKDKLPELARIK
jgi:hypothetical protein